MAKGNQMSTVVNVLHPAMHPQIFEGAEGEAQSPVTSQPARRTLDQFAEEQIRRLVREVFAPGRPKPARHVVFSAVDEGTYVAEMCMDVAKALSAQVSGSVCLIEGNPHHPELENVFGSASHESTPCREGFGFLRESSRHITGKLWLAPLNALLGDNGNRFSAAWLERRLSDFRLEFDYTVLHTAPAGLYGEAAVLGRLSDGVVLVLEANLTRRVTAQRTKEMLQAANARVLGTVLSERTFPIPEGIYRRL
jgi:succinoglycan biosynthesis transport protein ExoP